MNSTNHPVQELHEKPPQQPTTTTESAKDTVSSIGDSVSDLATTSWNGLKSTATNVASNEHVQNTWTQIRSATIGPAEGETPEPVTRHPSPSPEENRQIDEMEKEKIVEFLREKHRSDAPKPAI
ncbi:hypothetical protein P168DRAFT_283852 [Aspergillus campestris IBT 28561]|uniref:Uncharacterized protein n=1 Tax=Aspergillus campestris (strain IBT 28561) TaxID=1392248 RepID=A0A2I1CWU8_ASPC2|nr:uncharacterized protein P168DRAFT_283852 [Aspergillus campestris IBT 28561]PKY02098.1 hypothetical protein P168DRAFT_283852 [Aspergillus campestris IBT 28561]